MDQDPAIHSRRTLSLRFDIPMGKAHEFWDSLREGRFVTTKCATCGHVSFPPQADCPACMSAEFEWEDLGREATLVTFTQVQVTPASFSESDPYLVAIGEMGGGVKVLAWLEGLQPSEAVTGMKLRVETRGAEGPNPYYVFVKA
jgi:uncharacterized OB-fold protein